MLTYQWFNNWTTAETRAYASKTLAGRMTTGDIIRGFGAAWGVIPLFAPPPASYVPAAHARESIFLNIWNEKQWTTQTAMLAQQAAAPDRGRQGGRGVGGVGGERMQDRDGAFRGTFTEAGRLAPPQMIPLPPHPLAA